MKQITAILLICIIIIGAAGCANEQAVKTPDISAIQSFRDIPGITGDEIAAIEALQNEREYFTCGILPSNDAFIREDGTFGGYTILLYGWMSELFGIPFIPEQITWTELTEGLENSSVDFTCNLTPTDERIRKYFMTDAIAHHWLCHFRLENSEPLDKIAMSRPLRYVLIEETTTVDDVLRYAPGDFEIIYVAGIEYTYDVLKSGQADSFITENIAESYFDDYSDIVTEDFIPLVDSPVSLATQNPQLEPIISAVQKVLDSGGYRFFDKLYDLGYNEYTKHKFLMNLTAEEKEYIKANPVIPYVAEYDNYPLSFYNTRINEWQGAGFDVLGQIEKLTGLRFEIINDEQAEWHELLEMLETKQAYFVTELLRTPERESRFLWPDTAIAVNRPILMSLTEQDNISLNKVPTKIIGVQKSTAYNELFRSWFPNHNNIIVYDSQSAYYDALFNGEVDMIMSSYNSMLYMTNYLERVDVKPNIIFDNTSESTFGFHKDAAVLCSIFNKALKMIDTVLISDQWIQRTYDYRAKVAEARIPWLISTSILSFIILVLMTIVLFVFYRNRKASMERVAERMRDAEKQKLIAEEANRRLEAIALREQESNQLKSRFLATMSHEIRTPMNAIIGMTEIALREPEPDAVKEHIHTIKHAGANMLALINDILDFSKIEAGKLEIVAREYSVASLLNDLVSIIRMRVVDSEIRFAVKADSNIPRMLIGDETRIRQAALNVLSNAVKYTEEGSITFCVHAQITGNDTLSIIFKVTDTGIGIKPEDIDKLFTTFTQLNPETNRSKEGVGLGLAITRSIIEAMGGDIAVQSEYGKGSTFTITIPQKYYSREVLAEVSAPEEKKALIYISDDVCADSAAYALETLGINYEIAGNITELYHMMKESRFDFLFVSSDLYQKNEEMISELKGETKIAVLSKFGDIVSLKNISTLTVPVYCVNIAEMLGGVSDRQYAGGSSKNPAGFTAPDARVLIVDDMSTNLKVAEGLLLPYKMRVELADGGAAAIEAVQKSLQSDEHERYDLIFMDHKMPVVNGVEATQRIREMGEPGSYCKEIPIVALTANAVSGTMEMFIENGFNDFLSKPIDIIKLDAVLEKWIPKEKKKRSNRDS